MKGFNETLAARRPGFAELLKYARKGNSVHVYAVDRLGRDAIDIETSIKTFLATCVSTTCAAWTCLPKVGELSVAVLAQVAEMERERLRERISNGKDVDKASLAATGKTQRGKDSLGKPAKGKASAVPDWRKENKATIPATAKQFNLSDSTVKRYCLTVS